MWANRQWRFWKTSPEFPDLIPSFERRYLTVLGLFYFDCLSGNSDHDVMRLHVTRYHRASADHCIISNLDTGQHGGVISQSDAVADTRLRRINLVDIVDIVIVGIDVGIVRNGDVVANLDPATVVQQNIAMNDHVVSERQVVTE